RAISGNPDGLTAHERNIAELGSRWSFQLPARRPSVAQPADRRVAPAPRVLEARHPPTRTAACSPGARLGGRQVVVSSVVPGCAGASDSWEGATLPSRSQQPRVTCHRLLS